MTSQESAPKCVYIVVDQAQTASPTEFGVFSGWQWDFLRSKILRSGLNLDQIKVVSLADILVVSEDTLQSWACSSIVGMGEQVLFSLTQKKSIDKWHLSPLRAKGVLFIPTFDFKRVQKQWECGLYIEMAFHRAAEWLNRPWEPVEERFHLNPGIEETLEILDYVKTRPIIATDVETGYGQINTIGFAWSKSDAIAIQVLPDSYSEENYFRLMRKINEVLSSPAEKVLQNFIYDYSYYSAYGFNIQGSVHDTMWMMKILWPEFKSGLDNVGRFYTRRIYWKDDGKVTDAEGKKKNWGDIRDWTKHFTYNCRDTTGSFEACENLLADINARGLTDFYYKYKRRLVDPIREMCAEGMPLCLETKAKLEEQTTERLNELVSEFKKEVGYDINPRSPTQVMKYLKGLGINLVKKFNKEKGEYRESADSSAIKRIRLKVPDNKALALLQEIKSLDKILSSYVKFEPRPDGRLTYSLNGAGTESLRWSGSKDPWGRGFNIQTIPREGGDVSIKSMFFAPAEYVFMEIDLRQAESRFVAYDSADKTLIDMLESGDDVHTHVGNAILRQMGRDPERVTKEEFKSTWRQLGKKAGHGLNYGMKAGVFVETVFSELDLVITKKDAEQISEAYFGLFPGIKRWHSWIRNELYTKRRLSAPSGWERYFYGRPDDALKEALSWRPQHTIPWITNHLMLALTKFRDERNLKLNLIAQVHDSLIMLAHEKDVNAITNEAMKLHWHPEVILPGGRMIIPIEVKAGKRMSELKEVGG